MEDELRRREEIFAALRVLTDQKGGFLNREDLTKFSYNGIGQRLIDINKGIWNPQNFVATLSILSGSDAYSGADEILENGLHAYAYQKIAPGAGNTNLKLRRAMELELPLLLLQKVKVEDLKRTLFVPIFPVYIVNDRPTEKRFEVAVDESFLAFAGRTELSMAEKKYVERIVKSRLHQPAFRVKVLSAYDQQCTICALKHPSLLDAAHITPDSDALGVPEVSNGMSMCKIHHAPYDQNFIGISPDYTVQVNNELLQEVDGPMLKHGIQEMNGKTLILPTNNLYLPDRERLANRFELFKAS